MNVRIFWVCAMECMCAQTRPWVYTLIRKGFEGMESETMLTPREKSPLPEAQRRFEPAILHQAGQQVQHIMDWAVLAPRLGFDSCFCHGSFSRSSLIIDLKISTPVVTLPGTWHDRVSTGTGWSSVSILWLDEMESLICKFFLIVAACTIASADLSLR